MHALQDSHNTAMLDLVITSANMRKQLVTKVLLKVGPRLLLHIRQFHLKTHQHDIWIKQAQVAKDQMREQELHADIEQLKAAVQRVENNTESTANRVEVPHVSDKDEATGASHKTSVRSVQAASSLLP